MKLRFSLDETSSWTGDCFEQTQQHRTAPSLQNAFPAPTPRFSVRVLVVQEGKKQLWLKVFARWSDVSQSVVLQSEYVTKDGAVRAPIQTERHSAVGRACSGAASTALRLVAAGMALCLVAAGMALCLVAAGMALCLGAAGMALCLGAAGMALCLGAAGMAMCLGAAGMALCLAAVRTPLTHQRCNNDAAASP